MTKHHTTYQKTHFESLLFYLTDLHSTILRFVEVNYFGDLLPLSAKTVIFEVSFGAKLADT